MKGRGRPTCVTRKKLKVFMGVIFSTQYKELGNSNYEENILKSGSKATLTC